MTLLLTESTLRVVWRPPRLTATLANGPHPEYVWFNLAGITGWVVTSEYTHSFRHTRQHLRAGEVYTADLPPSIRARVLVLGDSFVYGLGAEDEETFVALLGAGRRDVQFINAGCSGFGTKHELAALDRFGAALAPDIVVLGFFANDLRDNRRARPQFEQGPDGRVRRLDSVKYRDDPLALFPAERARRPSWWRNPYVVELARNTARAFRGQDPARLRHTPEEFEHDWATTQECLRLVRLRADEIGGAPRCGVHSLCPGCGPHRPA